MNKPNPRVMEIIRLASMGYTADQISKKTRYRPATIRTYLKETYMMTGTKNITNLVATAIREGWIE